MLSTVFAISCVTLNSNIPKHYKPVKRSSAPVDAFVLVEVLIEARPLECHSKDPDIDCEALLKELPILRQRGSGSGILVTSDSGPVILTAAHVCVKDTPDVIKQKNVTISVLTLIKFKIHSPLKGDYSALVLRTDKEKDLCMLRPETVFTDPVPIAKNAPVIGAPVYSIAAPFGIGGKNLALIFHGFYSGVGATPMHSQVHFYTIPTRPGSSGAAVFNKDWEVVGMLHTAFRGIENVGMGAGLDDIRSFLFSSKTEVTVTYDETLYQP